MADRIQDLLIDRAARGFFGRTEEIETLLGAFAAGQPPVWYLHGIAGVGKSRLLDVVIDRARGMGVCVIRIDCREIEPTATSFLAELAQHVGAVPGPVTELADRIADLGDRVLIALDGYESFRLLDSWIRQEFVPALPQSARIFLVGPSRACDRLVHNSRLDRIVPASPCWSIARSRCPRPAAP